MWETRLLQMDCKFISKAFVLLFSSRYSIYLSKIYVKTINTGTRANTFCSVLSIDLFVQHGVLTTQAMILIFRVNNKSMSRRFERGCSLLYEKLKQNYIRRVNNKFYLRSYTLALIKLIGVLNDSKNMEIPNSAGSFPLQCIHCNRLESTELAEGQSTVRIPPSLSSKTLPRHHVNSVKPSTGSNCFNVED